MSPHPTKRHYKVLEAIREFIAAHGYGPTIDDIVSLTGITSKGVVYFYMQKLYAEDLITWERSKSRTIQLVGVGEFMRIPRVETKKSKVSDKPRTTRLTGKGREAYEAECFEKAVQMGLERDAHLAGAGALHNSLGLFPNKQVHASKVG